MIRVGVIYYFWNDTTILPLVASLSLLGPFWNSIMLAYPETRKNPLAEAPGNVILLQMRAAGSYKPDLTRTVNCWLVCGIRVPFKWIIFIGCSVDYLWL
jgi:hypothetical protein